MKLPEPKYSTVSLIYKHYESIKDEPRPHLGASLLGHPCDRKIWLSFRWAVRPEFLGRMLRLFKRGHDEEAKIISDLRAIGCDVRKTGRNQLRVEFGSHVAGNLDGIIESGVPESPKKRHVLEMKTHNKKSFEDLVKNGVEKSKPEHYVQMQIYMLGAEIDRALYVAVCKDDDNLHVERVRLDESFAKKYVDRGKKIAMANRMPEPMSGASASWYVCKMCDSYKFCWEERITKHVNCRTCAHSTPMQDSTWRCERHESDGIPIAFQLDGCESHVLHPDVVPYQLKDSPDKWTAIYLINGKDVANGEGDRGVYTSKEILANPKMCAAGDEFVEGVREEFGGRISG